MLNPMKLLKVINERKQLTRNHPEFIPFLKETLGSDISVGTVIEISVAKPGQEEKVTKINVQKSELPLFKKLQDVVKEI
ncbi:MAG: hypothetical protein ACRC3H_02845 [Lachnospiraceae bacterium]